MSSEEHESASVRILIVDDDEAICMLLKNYLSGQGFNVTSLPDGSALKATVDAFEPDLIVMDLMLPGEDGLSLVRQLRTDSNVPVIMLSARSDDIDRIVGLEVGADDYLAKPFNPRELLARIRAVLRRNHAKTDETEHEVDSSNSYCFGPYTFYQDRGVLHRDGEDVGLTSGEAALLEIFIEHANRLLSRDQLMDFIQGRERMPFDRSVDVRVTRLRGKIEEDGRHPVYIRTVWGKGYRFTPNGADT